MAQPETVNDPEIHFVIVTYAEFAMGGAIASERAKVRVTSEDPRALTWPQHAYAIRFCFRTEIEANGETLVGEWRLRADDGWQYRNGKIYTEETLPLDMSGRHNVLSTMQSASRPGVPARVCETCTGRVVIINPADVAIEIP